MNIPLSQGDNLGIVIDEYKGWIYDVGSNIGTLTGYIVKVEWLPGSDIDSVRDSEAPRHTTVVR